LTATKPWRIQQDGRQNIEHEASPASLENFDDQIAARRLHEMSI
jgi:hypothetical protein